MKARIKGFSLFSCALGLDDFQYAISWPTLKQSRMKDNQKNELFYLEKNKPGE